MFRIIRIIKTFICAAALSSLGAYGFMPVAGIVYSDDVFGVYQNHKYIAKKTFTSSLSRDEVMERCYLIAKTTGWTISDGGCDQALEGITARSGDFLWHVTVDEKKQTGGCDGFFTLSFPRTEEGVLPTIGKVYDGAKVVLKTVTRQDGLERQFLTLECPDPPDVVMPYICRRFVVNGWVEQTDLNRITSQFSEGPAQGHLFSQPKASAIVIATQKAPASWWYILQIKQISG